MMYDPHNLRRAFGTFATGVTVVTTKSDEGVPRGFTANSFSSVSMEPALLSICVANSAFSAEAFRSSGSFAINVLSYEQKGLSSLFASKDPSKFEKCAWHDGRSGCPVLNEVAAWFDCSTERVIEAGDHFILLGRIDDYGHRDCGILGYALGKYVEIKNTPEQPAL